MAISHAFSNAVSDGTNTNIVRPSDWNSAHNQYYTLSGNTLGNSTVSGTNVVFQGSGNVSLSGTGSTIIVYGTGGGGGGVAVSAGTQSVSTGTVSFANSNGITFGMSGSSQITASFSQSVQTQASGNIVGAGFTTATTAGTAIVGTHDSLGLSLGVPAYLTTQSVQTQASGNIAGTGFTTATTAGSVITGALGTNGLNLGIPAYLTAAGAVNFSAGTTSNNLQTVVFSDGNGVSFGLNGSTITASVASGAGGINAGVSNLGNTGGSTGTVSTGNVVFVGVNNISLSQSTGAVGSAATISIIGEPPISRWAFPNPNNQTFVSTFVNASASVNMIQVPHNISGTRMDILMFQSLASSATTNTYALAYSVYMGIYSNDSANNRLVSLSSGSTQTTHTLASNTAGATALLQAGIRPVSCPVNFFVTPGQYMVVANWVTTASSVGLSTTALGQTLSVVGNPMATGNFSYANEFELITANSNLSTMPTGVFTAASTGIPATISYSQLSMGGARRLQANFMVVFRGE